MNMRGPFGEQVPGKFAMAAGGILQTHDRPTVKHRGVRVMRHDSLDLTQVDEYPDATGWEVDDRGQLDVYNEDSKHHFIAAYPEGTWKRVWFPAAEEKTPVFQLPGEDENGEVREINEQPD